MIQLLLGDDTSSILDYISSIRKTYESNNIYSFEGVSKNRDQIIDKISSTGLFSPQMLIIVKVKANENPDFNTAQLVEDTSKLLVLYGSVNAKFTSVKNLKKLSTIKTFEKKSSDIGFVLCDAMFLSRNKKKAIELINEYSDLNNEIFPLISLIQTYLRNLISKTSDNATWQNLNPYFRSKFEKSTAKYSLSELSKIMNELHSMDVSIKSGKAKNIKAILQDFVIYWI